MKVVNHCVVSRATDHILLRLVFLKSKPKDESDMGDEEPVELVVPITTAARLGLDLFGSVIQSTTDMTQFFMMFQGLVNDLNKMSAEQEGKKADILAAAATEAAANAARGGGTPSAPTSTTGGT